MNITEQIEELISWPCQQLHGGHYDFVKHTNEEGLCKHPECHPDQDDRQTSDINLDYSIGVTKE